MTTSAIPASACRSRGWASWAFSAPVVSAIVIVYLGILPTRVLD